MPKKHIDRRPIYYRSGLFNGNLIASLLLLLMSPQDKEEFNKGSLKARSIRSCKPRRENFLASSDSLRTILTRRIVGEARFSFSPENNGDAQTAAATRNSI